MKDTRLANIIPYRSIDRGVVDLRGTGIMVPYELHGPPPGEIAARANESRLLAAALVHLGTGDVVQVLTHHEPASPPLPPANLPRAAALVEAERRAQFDAEAHWTNTSRIYLSHFYENGAKSLVRAVLSSNGDGQHKDLLRDYALNRFSSFADAASGAIRLRRLDDTETFRALLQDIRYENYPAILPAASARLNEVIGDERMIGGLKPYIGGYHLRAVCITAYPSQTVPQILAVLLRQPCRMTISSRFICLDGYDARAALEAEKKHWRREIIGSIWKAVKGWFGKSQQADQDTLAQLADIDDAIAAAAGGMAFGHFTVVAIVKDEDAGRATLFARELIRECHSMGIMARLEGMNATEAIEGSWPGAADPNLRRNLVSGANWADIILPAEYWAGLLHISSPFYREATPTPLVLGGAGSKVPFALPTHVNGVASQLIVGPAGVGKSTLLGAMVSAYLGVPKARIAWLDLDYSSFVLAHLLGAQYHDIGAADSSPLCPLSMLDQEGGLEWLASWFERLFARWNFDPDERQSEEFHFRLREARRTGVRTLSGLRALIPGEQKRIRQILQHYITYWGSIYGGDTPAGITSKVTVYELRTLMGMGKRASGPATELILHNIVSQLDGSPAWIFADEFWQLLGDETSAEWLFDTIRTLRKKNAGFVGCTQSLVEIANSPYRDLLLESCPGRILLPNHQAVTEFGRENYRHIGLSDYEISIIAGARPAREAYYSSPIGSRLFSLDLGPVGQRIVACTNYNHVAEARRILEESPNGYFLDNWLSGQQSLPIAAAA